jgi:hypothetical protein
VRYLIAIALCGAGAVARAQSCPAGQTLCGTGHCAPVGNVCCASVGHEEVSCSPTFVCTSDGKCSSTCTGGQASSIASCGSDTCSCSAPCKHHKDCESTCCTTAGFCAPLCVCDGLGKLYVGCDFTTPGAGPLPIAGGCHATPRAPTADFAAILFALALLPLLRRKIC